MNPPTTPDKKHSVPPLVTLHQMPDGSFRIYGLRHHSRLHLTKAMRPWRRDEDEETGQTFYTSWDQHEADRYAAAHSLTILGPTAS